MRLSAALRLDQQLAPARVAFVGAGGKTTALFQLAHELPGPLLVTATTHLALAQLSLADRHYFEDQLPADLLSLARTPDPAVILVTGPAGAHGRTAGVTARTLAGLRALADQAGWPLLIEADGARRLPLKAPAEHEPPIPDFVDLVVVVAGLSGLGHPLDAAQVFRPEIFAALSGRPVGALVDWPALACVLAHAQGGLKNIPANARRVLLLNQADSPELQSHARRIATETLSAYDAVLCASFQPQPPAERPPGVNPAWASSLERPAGAAQTIAQSPNADPTGGLAAGTDGGTSVEQATGSKRINPSLPRPLTTPPVLALFEPLAAVILAAGGAARFGQPKQLLPWQGQPLAWHVAQAALQAGLTPVVVVGGAQLVEIGQALAGLNVILVANPDWAAGQSSSLRAGLAALPSGCGGVFFLLADQPQIPAELLRQLVELHRATRAPLVAPLVAGQRGNPVLFDRVTFPALAALSGDRGGRALFARYAVQWLPWHDERVLWDVDTPADYQRLLELQP